MKKWQLNIANTLHQELPFEAHTVSLFLKHNGKHMMRHRHRHRRLKSMLQRCHVIAHVHAAQVNAFKQC
ncbi:hypothetical protein PEC18_05275, partial [Paucibacter sp. O1-1]|nr:hypothetical protein [Paucibacter sp. O1-1]MDA3825280.1 hypothetical protein [Paucibacter sp. O1-1]